MAEPDKLGIKIIVYKPYNNGQHRPAKQAKQIGIIEGEYPEPHSIRNEMTTDRQIEQPHRGRRNNTSFSNQAWPAPSDYYRASPSNEKKGRRVERQLAPNSALLRPTPHPFPPSP